MSNSIWDKEKDLIDRHSASGGLFVRLAADGDKAVGAFVGEPYARKVHWTGERYEECSGDKGCEHCADGKKPSLRVAMNFYVLAEKALKVMEGGTAWFKDLMKVREEYGLDRSAFEIERHGAAGDTKTTYTILPDDRLTEEQRAEIAGLQFHDLAKIVSGGGRGAGGAGSGDFNSYDKAPSDALIDAKIASELVTRLKSLPRDAVDSFLKQFGVKRVRDLKAADEKAARAFVDGLEGKGGGKTGSGEVDPFA